MRVLNTKNDYIANNNIEKIICNCCGREIKTERGFAREGVMSADIDWGFFSKYDGEKHSFDLCMECYDKMINEFKIPVEKTENTELI